MKNIIITILIFTLIPTCNYNHKKIITLKGFQNQKEVIYQTAVADYYFGFNDLVNYCNKKDNGEPNDFVFKQIIEYLNTYPNQPILIPDTLGTKLAPEKEVMFTDSDSLIRIRDQNHPYAYITESIRWAIIDFARKGKLKIYNKQLKSYLDTVIINKINTNLFGETNITMTNDSIIFSELRWIR